MKSYVLCGMLALVLAACKDPLAIQNQNNPDRDRVFTNPTDLEQYISALYAVQHQGTIGGSNDGLQTQMMVMSMEGHSALANFAMGPRGQIPRNPITNARGSQGSGGNFHDWFREHRAARQAALGIGALDRMGTLGSATRDRRAKAFARLVQGIALGNLSLAYDSASILTENDNPEADAAVIVPLSGYRAVNTAALGYLDSAIAIAQTAPTGTFLPGAGINLWIAGLNVSRDDFIRIARSYKARFRADVARTPADRRDVGAGGIVDWTLVIADANAGITADLRPIMDQTQGWDVSWVAQAFATGSANWHQLSQFWLFMADTQHNAAGKHVYDDWLDGTITRGATLVVTPDRRFPRGTTRGTSPKTSTGTQVFNSPGPGGSATQNDPIPWDSVPYIRNRPPGEDQSGAALQVSMYDFYRSRAFRNANRVGAYPVLTRAQIRLLAAEGYLRLGQVATAVTLIDSSRTRWGGLPSLASAGIADTLTSVPGASACVPRVPEGPAFTTTTCGRVWDAFKWEYRLETWFTGYGTWFFAARGWGDLPEGTATYWPVPFQEMDAREQPFYPSGGVGSSTGAGPGNYGLRCGVLFICS
jgi:hypothetical protein